MGGELNSFCWNLIDLVVQVHPFDNEINSVNK